MGADLPPRAARPDPDLEPVAPLHALREFEQFYNSHRPHQRIANARPLRALPAPIPEPTAATRLHIHRRDRLSGILYEYRHAA